MMLRPVDASCHLFSYQVEKQHLRPTLLHQAEPLHNATFSRDFVQVVRKCEIKTVDSKFVFSKKATKIDEIFTVNLTLCSKCQIDGEDFFNFCGLLRKHEL